MLTPFPPLAEGVSSLSDFGYKLDYHHDEGFKGYVFNKGNGVNLEDCGITKKILTNKAMENLLIGNIVWR